MLVLVLMLALVGWPSAGARGSKKMVLLAFLLSICHSQNYEGKHQETGICFLVTRKRNFVSETLKQNYVSARNEIWFPSHAETEFRFHLKQNSVSGLHHSINPNSQIG
jgi:hypothetical protein